MPSFKDWWRNPLESLERSLVPENPLARTAVNAGLGLIPGIGPLLATSYGALGGYKGYKQSGGRNWWEIPLGALGGYGAGAAGAGLGAGFSNAMKAGTLAGFGKNFATGAQNYANTSIIPGASWSAPGSWFPTQGAQTRSTIPQGWSIEGGYGGVSPFLAPGEGSGIMSQFNAAAGGVAPGAGFGAGVGNAFASGMNTAPGISAVTTAPGASANKGIMSAFKDPYTIAGLATSALGSFSGKTPQIPQSDLYGQVTSRLLGEKGFSELGKLGREQLKGQLTNEFESVPDEYYNASKRNLVESFNQARQNYISRYKALRPGADVENDTGFREGLAKIDKQQAEQESALSAELDYRREGDYLNRKYQNIMAAIGLDDTTMQTYMALAQLDTERLASNTGISVGEAARFKELFGDLGSFMIKKGMGLDLETALGRLGIK